MTICSYDNTKLTNRKSGNSLSCIVDVGVCLAIYD